ncbi:MFS transporter [Geodermatophilus sp. CPCC 205506]|uniref:MFS transporter n=1 Tax=Geodermatophilus sp. CPCC 205506 TaxID=2936596 RepID=UPI003EEC6CE7
MLAASLIDSIGTGLFLAGSALFFTRAVGLGTGQVGSGLSLAGVIGLLCAVPIGRLADRLGSKRALVLLLLWRGAGFLAYLFVDGFWSFVAVACLLGATEWAVGPVLQALVGATEEPASRVRTMAAIRAVRNAGFACGALLATLGIAQDSAASYRALVVANAISFCLAAALLARRRVPPHRPAPRQAAAQAVRVHDPRYLVLATANGVLVLHPILLSLGLPLWIASRTNAPPALVGVIVTINTVLAVVAGLRLSRRVEGVRAFAKRQHWSGWCLALCCALVAVTESLDGLTASIALLIAAVALTLGEVWQSIGAWGLSYALSPEDRRNYYLSVYNLGQPVAAIIGPVLLTTVVLSAGAVGWLALAGAFAATGVGARVVATWYSPKRAHRGGRSLARGVRVTGPPAVAAVLEQA